MNIVVTSPKTVDITHKMKDPYNSFWSLKRRPKNLKVGDIVWVVVKGVVVGGFSVRKIIRAKHPVKDAIGHNPSDCWRIWFEANIDYNECVKQKVLSPDGDFLIKVRGFQGFRYQWW